MYNIVFELAFLGLIFYSSLLLSLLLVPLSSKLAFVVGVVDLPDSRKVHSRAVPRMGGVAIVLALLTTLLLLVRPNDAVKAYLLGAGIVSFVGLMDDRFGISPRLKFFGEFLAASAFVMASGLTIHSFGDLLGLGEIRTFYLAPLVTIFCMVGVMNALNLSDGLDGLAGGIGFMAALFLALLAYWHQAWYWVNISLALVGVLLGFLRYNHYPASLFMGDTGSLLIGYTLSAVAVGLAQIKSGTSMIHPVSLAIILSLPIVDTIYVMFWRLLHGRNPFHPDKRHLHHRLLKLGIGHAGVVSIIYGLMLFFGFWSWLLRHRPEWQQFYMVFVCYVILYIALWLIERKETDAGRIIGTVRLIPARKITVRNRFFGWAMRVCPYVFFILFLSPSLIIMPVPRPFGILALSAALFIIIVYPWFAGKDKILLGHGIIYAGLFFLLSICNLQAKDSFWILFFLYGTSFLAFFYVIIRVLTSRSDPILYPSGFELLLIFSSWICPFALQPILHIGLEDGLIMLLTCAQSLIWLCLIKLMIRRKIRRNLSVSLGLALLLTVLGISSFT